MRRSTQEQSYRKKYAASSSSNGSGRSVSFPAGGLLLGGFIEGEGHVVEIESEDGVAEKFESDGGVEEAVGLVDGFGGEVDLSAFFGERDVLEAFFAGVGDAHGCAAVGEREHAGVSGGIGAVEAESVDRRGVDEHRAGVHGVELSGDTLAVNGEAVGDDDGWAVFAKGDQRDRVALAETFDWLGQNVGDSKFAGDEIELDDAVFEGGVGEATGDVGHLVLIDHFSEVHAESGDLRHGHGADVQ